MRWMGAKERLELIRMDVKKKRRVTCKVKVAATGWTRWGWEGGRCALCMGRSGKRWARAVEPAREAGSRK